MKSVKNQQEEVEQEEEEIVSNREGLSYDNKDGKNNKKTNATRSKHSVTEQRRRCKINERFQILRDLIPHSEQKRDTASFLLEVIEYVQYLQGKVQKYEGSYQGLSMQPTKLMPWRNSHWRGQSLVGPTQAIKNDSGPVSTFPGRLDENDVSSYLIMHPNSGNPTESDPSRDPSRKTLDQQPSIALPISLHASVTSSGPSDGIGFHPIERPIFDAQTTGCPITNDALIHREDFVVEGGRISLTSVYSQGLLNNLTQALQSAGVDLSQATISVQIDLGKRANRRLTSGVSSDKDPHNTSPSDQPILQLNDAINSQEPDQPQKRRKI